MSTWQVFAPVLIAALFGGASAGVTGVFTVGLRIPFLSVCSAHAALAGAVGALLLAERTGVRIAPSAAGFAGSLTAAALLGLALRRRDLEPNAALGVLFSLVLGLTFLGVGLLEGPKSEALGLIWGSVLFVTRGQLAAMAVVAAGLGVFVTLWRRELELLLFSRQLAALLIPEAVFFGAVLFLASAVIAVNLEIVGGLLLFSLLSNPAVAALRVGRRFVSVLWLSAAFGAGSAVGGLALAYAFDLPAGACIVLASSGVVAAAFAWNRLSEKSRNGEAAAAANPALETEKDLSQ